ncbi:MAG: hypothetical protein WCK35_19495 [Chloroflexota bacterium]
MTQKAISQGDTYRIRIKGILDRRFADWFGDIAIIPQKNGETVLIGDFSDQPALRGFMEHLWNFNFTVLSVERSEDENTK